MSTDLPGPTEIVEDVYDITYRADYGRRYRCFLDVSGTPTLFDVSFESEKENLFAGIEAVGVEPERLVITHGDADHGQAFDSVVDRYDVETWVNEVTELGTGDEMKMNPEHEPDHRYGHGDTIGPYEAIHVPGHTPDNFSLVDESRALLVVGDTVFGSDFRGMPAGYLGPPPEVYNVDHTAAEANLEVLLDYEFETALIFHGSSVLEDAHGKLDRYINFPGRQRFVDRFGHK